MQTTTNYGLKKPQGADLVNIDDLNFNADTLDGNLKTVETTAGSAKSAAAAAQSTADKAVHNAATAQSTADKAVHNAAVAQNTADKAVGDAATAQNTALQAVSAITLNALDDTGDLDDVEVGEFKNSGIGWNTHMFREPFCAVPLIFMQAEGEYAVHVKTIAVDKVIYALEPKTADAINVSYLAIGFERGAKNG